MSSSSFIVQFDVKRADELRKALAEQGFSFAEPPHTLFQGKKEGIICTLYASGKLMVQGKKMKEFIEYFLEPEILRTFTYGYDHDRVDRTPRIGIDESGKGDYFGPLCVAGIYADATGIETLLKLGVKDSKKLQDSTICTIGPKIRKEFAHELIRIGPPKYNELIEKFGNLNLLLGWGHATAIDNLIERTKCENVIIDQFAAEHVVIRALKQKKREALLKQRPRAEEDVVVAAASILARECFLLSMKALSEKIGVHLPKGAGSEIIKVGKKLVQEHGREILPTVAKVHFKTTQQILEGSP